MMRNPDEREGIPEERMSEERVSEERMPEERTSEERMSEERMSEERMPEHRMSGERMSEERMSESRMSEDRSAEEPMGQQDLQRERMDRPPTDARRQSSFMSIPDAESYMQRFEAVQAEFIDEPRQAVEKAESLVSEAIDRMMDSLKQELHRSRARSDGDGGDETEQLRIAMKRYRDLLHSFSQRMV
jgi:hypothetical protein